MSVSLDIFKYGYSTDINNTYAVVGNPSSFLLHPTIVGTGSVEVYKYNTETNNYSYFTSLVKSYQAYANDILLLTNTSSVDETVLNADTASVPTTGLYFQIDADARNFILLNDAYGVAVAISSSRLVVGCPYSYYAITRDSDVIKRSGSVDVYNLNNVFDSYVQILPDYTIENTSSLDENGTFGETVSMYDNVLIVGSSGANNNRGAFYIYTQSLSNSWDLCQSFSGSFPGQFYGASVDIDYSGSKRIIVGNKSTASVAVDVYEYDSDLAMWHRTDSLHENRLNTGSLNFIDSPPYIVSTNSSSYFGRSVSIYGNYIGIGAPNDMYYLEYSGSSELRNRGAVYFYYKCADESGWRLLEKSFGNSSILKTNNFGKKIDIYGNYAVVANTKDIINFSSSFITASINKKFDCNINDEYIDNLGQFAIFKLNSNEDLPSWNLLSVINKKKKFGYPYLAAGYDVSIQEDNIILGAPLLLADSQNMISASNTNIKGYSYVYNLNDLYTDYQVGNVFYKNGKIILSNSGSIFQGLLKDKSNQLLPKYDIEYKSTMTLFEKQIICRIEANEFNFSTNPTALIQNIFSFDIDGNNNFNFVDLDLIFRAINDKINGNQRWYNYFDFTEDEYSVFLYYYEKYNLSNINGYRYINKYIDKIESVYDQFDIDDNGKINFNDVYLLWKYFVNKLTKEITYKYIDLKSTRKTKEDIIKYIDVSTGKNNYGNINPLFFEYDTSSSMDRTGSYLAPYITTIGLYSGLDLVAVAKLGEPIKNSGDLPLNILVKWDM